jgi:hypothetical protein
MALTDFAPSSFLTNPLVGAIASAASNAAPNGAVAAITSQLAAPKITPMRSPVQPQRTEEIRDSAAVRAGARFNTRAPGNTRGTTPGVGGVGMNLPGVMSPDVLMHPEVQKLLSMYGVSPEDATNAAQTASPNLFVTNPGAYAKHPVLSGLLERGLEGAAFTHGSNTWGEGISNVAQGLLNAQGARADKYNNQLMMPFAQATQVAQLKGINLQQEYEQAQTAKAESMSNYYDQLPEIKSRLADLANDRLQDQETQRRSRANFQAISALHDVSLNPEEQARFNQTYADAGGDPSRIDPGVLLDIHSSALQRKIAQQDAAKMSRTKVAATGRIDTTAAANARAQRAGKLTAMKDAADAAEKDVQGFDRDLAAGAVTTKDANGNDQILYPFSDDANIAKARQTRMDNAEAKRKAYFDASNEAIQPDSSPLVMPGVMPSKTTPKKNTSKRPHGVMQADGTIKWD